MANIEQVHKMLEGGYSGVPQPQDTEKQVNLDITLPTTHLVS